MDRNKMWHIGILKPYISIVGLFQDQSILVENPNRQKVDNSTIKA